MRPAGRPVRLAAYPCAGVSHTTSVYRCRANRPSLLPAKRLPRIASVGQIVPFSDSENSAVRILSGDQIDQSLDCFQANA